MTPMQIPEDKLIWMYEKMVEIRKFEEVILDVYRKGLVSETCHLSTGQEAVSTGVCANLTDRDYILSTHRAHAHSIAGGVPLFRIMAEILGRVDGCCRGRGGSMRLAFPEKGVMYSSSIVGSNIPISVGVGLSVKLKGLDSVVACFFSDGASNTGSFHEGLNLAAIWNTPVVFVCENNQYAISMPVARSTSVENIADRAKSYDVPGIVVDGNDVLAVYSATKEAVDKGRKGLGPSLVECKTYRWLGHYTGDPDFGLYRTEDEVKKWRKKCPIEKMRKFLIQRGVAKNGLEEIDETVALRVSEALEQASKMPLPPSGELNLHVY